MDVFIDREAEEAHDVPRTAASSSNPSTSSNADAEAEIVRPADRISSVS
jgi:hypothetical protein